MRKPHNRLRVTWKNKGEKMNENKINDSDAMITIKANVNGKFQCEIPNDWCNGVNEGVMEIKH